tara:strand:- start:419 stop:697 length:279 start_codon:yes stop_codon:yes gene_type:complete
MKLIHKEIDNCTRCPFVHFRPLSSAHYSFSDKARKEEKGKPHGFGIFSFNCGHKDAPEVSYLGKVEPEKPITPEEMELPEFPDWCPLEDVKE